jgi:hypothetical protein
MTIGYSPGKAVGPSETFKLRPVPEVTLFVLRETVIPAGGVRGSERLRGIAAPVTTLVWSGTEVDPPKLTATGAGSNGKIEKSFGLAGPESVKTHPSCLFDQSRGTVSPWTVGNGK